MRKIGVLTGGGDAPGLNAVIRAVVKTAIRNYGWKVMGIEDGFEGLLRPANVRMLDFDDVRGLLPRGGTILGTVNRGHFAVAQSDGASVKDEAAYKQAVDNFHQLGLDALVVIGGDGSHLIAHELSKMGVAVVGVPKTIDNDLAGTEMTFGFDTALGISTEAIDRLHTTAESHNRVILVEVMGRYVGWIALQSGIAGGADVILIPEIPFLVEKVADKIRERDARGSRFSIVVVAEGAKPSGGDVIYKDQGGQDRAPRLGGIAEDVASKLQALTGKECRVVVLGHLQRGGTPTAFDRVLASCYGAAAVDAIAADKLPCMVAWNCSNMITVPLENCVNLVKVVPTDHYLISTARSLGISFAGEAD